MKTLLFAMIILGSVVAWQLWQKQTIPTISFEQLQNDPIYANYQRLDVRSVSEFKGGHLHQFKNIPLDQLDAQLKQIDKAVPIAVMCASGNRSASATKLLIKHGYQAVNLRGGIQSAPANFK